MENDYSEDIAKSTPNHWWHSMSKFWKLFWMTIATFLSITLILSFFAWVNTTIKPIERDVIISTDIILENITTSKPYLEEELRSSKLTIYATIDNKVDKAFLIAENNIDNYLDWHYTVMAEYVQLGSAATGTLTRTIEKKLLSSQFHDSLIDATNKINNRYKFETEKYTKTVNDVALKNVDLNLNTDIQGQIIDFEQLQLAKVSTIATVGLSGKILTTVSAKIATKSMSSEERY